MPAWLLIPFPPHVPAQHLMPVAPQATGQLAMFFPESLTLLFEQLADILQTGLESPDLDI